MEPINIIRRVMENQGQGAGIALNDMKALIEVSYDHPREQQKARQGRRFLSRWKAFEIDRILSEEDFLLTLRDTVLMLGKFPGTAAVSNLVGKKGEEFGLFEETTGDISADIPTDTFIRQAYGIDSFEQTRRPLTAGDKILKEETGFSNYRSFEQKVAVHTALQMPEGSTLLVTLSTGEGKSTVTQISAARDPGLTVLVVPTTALGKDQARAARKVLKRIPQEAVYDFCGDQTEKISELIEKLKKQEIRLLITSPEALVKNLSLRQAIARAAEEDYLSRLIIDEAHIVQDWGAAFRPDFQFLSLIRREWLQKSSGKLRTILLSATLTEKSTESLRELFCDENSLWIPVRCDSLRTEIRYMTDEIKWSPDLISVQGEKILHYVKTLPKPMLIYSIKPKEAEYWQKFLANHGIRNTTTFTGLTDDAERTDIIRKWSEDKLDIVLATSAFGMGIDKPDVRTVMHVVMPESINRFYQEVGRGGRDGLPSLSMLCCCPQAEFHQASNIAHRKIMTWEKMAKRWLAMIKVGNPEADIIELNTKSAPDYFDENEKERSGNRNRDWNLHTILFMVRQGWIELTDMKYAGDSGDYLIKVRMKDPALLQDEERMKKLGESPRQLEFDASDRELKIFQEMVREKENHCFAESFSRLYEHTDPDCGGCPQHRQVSYLSSGYRLHSHIASYINQGDIHLPFRIWRRNPCLLIEQKDPGDMNQALRTAIQLNQCGISTWIQPNNSSTAAKAEEFPGLVLNLEEANVLLDHHPALFGHAVLLTLGMNEWENQHLLEFGYKLIKNGTAAAFHMRPNTVFNEYGKPITQVVMCRTMTEQELQ